MLKKSITYTNPFNEEETVTEDFYFHLSEADIVELQVHYKEGWIETMQRLIREGDNEKIYETLKRVIFKAYGKRSENGRVHIKNDAVREEFEGSEAYSALLMELLQNTDLMIEFFNGIVPRGVGDPKVTALNAVSDPPRVVTSKEMEEMSQEDLQKLGAEVATGKVVFMPDPEKPETESEPVTEPEKPVA